MIEYEITLTLRMHGQTAGDVLTETEKRLTQGQSPSRDERTAYIVTATTKKAPREK